MSKLNQPKSDEIISKVRQWEAELTHKYGFPVKIYISGVRFEMYEIDEIVQSACIANNVDKDIVVSKARISQEVSSIRQSICLLSHMYTAKKMREIGMIFSQDHSSVINNIKAAKVHLETKDAVFMTVFNNAHNYLIANYSK